MHSLPLLCFDAPIFFRVCILFIVYMHSAIAFCDYLCNCCTYIFIYLIFFGYVQCNNTRKLHLIIINHISVSRSFSPSLSLPPMSLFLFPSLNCWYNNSIWLRMIISNQNVITSHQNIPHPHVFGFKFFNICLSLCLSVYLSDGLCICCCFRLCAFFPTHFHHDFARARARERKSINCILKVEFQHLTWIVRNVQFLLFYFLPHTKR